MLIIILRAPVELTVATGSFIDASAVITPIEILLLMLKLIAGVSAVAVIVDKSVETAVVTAGASAIIVSSISKKKYGGTGPIKVSATIYTLLP